MPVVRAPGSSANLGSGFDVLGAALNRHVWVGDEGDGPPLDEDHVAVEAFRRFGGRGPLRLEFDLPPGRGLGFSAAARAAAAVLALVQQGVGQSEARSRVYDTVADLEGHADNAAPAVFGGVQLVGAGRPLRLADQLPGRFLVWVPELETSTDGSRAELPGRVDRADAVFNLARVARWVAALHRQDPALVALATEDRLHQVPRLERCAPSRAALEAALDLGAHGAWLSGSGPSVALLAPPDLVDKLSESLPGDGRVLAVEVDVDGVVVEPGPDRPGA